MPLDYEYTCETRLGPFFTNDPFFVANLPFLTEGPVVINNEITLDPLGSLEDLQKEMELAS